MTVPGVKGSFTFPNRSKFKKRRLPMYDEQSLSHTGWDCKYHAIWIPTYRKKTIFRDLRRYLGEIFRELARQKESIVIEKGICSQIIFILCFRFRQNTRFSRQVGFIKGESAIQIVRSFQGRKKNFVDQNFWARGYYISTVGKDEYAVRAYIQHQEQAVKRLDQLRLFE